MLDRLRAVFRAHQPQRWPALPGRTNHLEAGVLVPVVWSAQPQVLAIVRAATLRRHANEVGFPGGKPEDGDADIEHTALREAREELGFGDIDVLGRLSSWPLYTSDYRLEPFVGLVSDTALVPEPEEVAKVLRFDLREWLARPAWEGVPFEMEGQVWVSPVFEHEGHVMYGGSALVLYEAMGLFAEVLGIPLPPLDGRRFGPEDILHMARTNA